MEKISTSNAPAAIGPYTQAIISGGVVYTSGQIALDPQTGVVVSDTIEDQTEQVCKNIGQVLCNFFQHIFIPPIFLSFSIFILYTL